MNNIVAEWTGEYPCLCHGKWILRVDDVDVSEYIPEILINRPMNTRGVFQKWTFGDDDFIEEWKSYRSGLKQDDWIEENKEWLNRINKDIEIQIAIYRAFKAKDWRYDSCGGCI